MKPADVTVEHAVAALEAHATIDAAAAYLGVSRETVRRRIRQAEEELGPAARAAIARRERARAARRAERVETSRITGRWRDAAECLDPDVSPELFFPSESATTALQTEQAKAVCAVCPVIEVCRRNALEGGTETDYGVFGGLTRNERRVIKRQMRGAA